MFKKQILNYKKNKLIEMHIKVTEKYFSFLFPIVDTNNMQPKDQLSEKERKAVLELILKNIVALDTNLYLKQLQLYNIDYKKNNRKYKYINGKLFLAYRKVETNEIQDLSEQIFTNDPFYKKIYDILSKKSFNIEEKILMEILTYKSSDLEDIKKRKKNIKNIFKFYYELEKIDIANQIGRFEKESDNIIITSIYYNIILFEKLFLNDFLDLLENTKNQKSILTIFNIIYLVINGDIRLHLLYFNKNKQVQKYLYIYNDLIYKNIQEQKEIDKFIQLLSKLMIFEELYIF